MAQTSGITKGNSVYKVPGGKLVKVWLAIELVNEGAVIRDISITGDFFIHPEEIIEALEEGLIGSDPNDAEININKILAAHEKVQLVGIEADDIAHAIGMASSSMYNITEL